MEKPCSELTNQEWVEKRFSGRCYFYTGRDCSGWKPGATCGRILEIIPQDAGEENEQGN